MSRLGMQREEDLWRYIAWRPPSGGLSIISEAHTEEGILRESYTNPGVRCTL